MQRDRAQADLAPDYNVAPTKKIYAADQSSPGPQDPSQTRSCCSWPGAGSQIGISVSTAWELLAGASQGRGDLRTIALRAELLEEFGVQRDRAQADLAPDYNVAPTKKIYAVLTRSSPGPQDPAPGDDEPAERQLRVVRWGLVPYWAKDRAIGSRMINARAETLAEKVALPGGAFARRRCLLYARAASAEWQQVADGGGKRKQPYYIYRSDGGVLTPFAASTSCGATQPSPRTTRTAGSGRRRSSPPAPKTRSARSTTGCRW